MKHHFANLLCRLIKPACIFGGVSILNIASVNSATKVEVLKSVLLYSDTEVAQFEKVKQDCQIEFSNLPLIYKKRFIASNKSAQALLIQNKYLKAYYHILEAEGIFKDNSRIQGNKGIVYLNLRLFKEAEVAFRHSLKIDPLAIGMRYNFGECLFAQKKFEESYLEFSKALKLGELAQLRDVIGGAQVKKQLCLIGLINSTAGKEREGYVKMYDELYADISKRRFEVCYYYILAIEHYRLGDKKGGSLWRRNAKYVFPDIKKHQIFVDALIEFGYVDSYYGGKSEKEESE